MMDAKKHCMAFALALVCGTATALAQSADDSVARLLNEKRFFELSRRLTPELKDSVSPTLWLIAEAMEADHFNKPAKACKALAELLENHSQNIGTEQSVGFAYLMARNMSRMGNNSEAAAVMRNIVQGLAEIRSDSSSVAGLKAEAVRMERLAELGEMCRRLHPKGDYTVSFFIDGAIHGYRKGGFLAMNANLNGVKRHVVLDTGAGVNVISSKDAQRCGLRLIDTGVRMRGVGVSSGQLAVADTLVIGAMTWVDVPFYIVDFKTGNDVADSVVGDGLPPILGLPWLNAVGELRIDFVKRTVTVPEQQSATPAGGRNLMINDNSNLSIETKDDNGKPLRMLFDTGSYETTLNSVWYERHKRQVHEKGFPDSLRFAGVGGVTIQHSYRMPSFKVAVGGAETLLDSVQVATGIDLHTGESIVSTAFDDTGDEGVLGLGALERFGMVTINMSGMFIEAEGTSEAYRREWFFDDDGNR